MRDFALSVIFSFFLKYLWRIQLRYLIPAWILFSAFFSPDISLMFVGHGMFAVGIHQVPGPFVDMGIMVFGMSEANARLFLIFAGSLDFLASLLLFIPRTELYALAFAICWGSITAFARIIANFDIHLAAFSSHQWVMETVYRLPHGLIPLAIFLYLKSKREDNNQYA